MVEVNCYIFSYSSSGTIRLLQGKEIDLGVVQDFWPLKETLTENRQVDIFYISSGCNLNETFTSKYKGVFPVRPKATFTRRT